MRYRILGERTGLRVAELALGTGNFGPFAGGADAMAAREIFDAYCDAGGNFIDCADFYQAGHAEETVAGLIRETRDQLVIASKYGLGNKAFGGFMGTGNGRKAMVRPVEASLRRLQTDRIDLYWAHMSDAVTPIDEILRGFDDLVTAGKVLYCGLSNFPAWRVSRGALLADMHGWAPVSAIQVEYNLVDRSAERELLPMAAALGLASCVYSPLAAGLLTGKFRAGGAPTKGVRANVREEKTPRDKAILDMLFELAGELGCTPTHIAIAWLRARADRAAGTQIPILGPRTPDQIRPAIEALAIDLDDDQLARLDAASDMRKGVPHDMIDHMASKDKLFAGRFDQVLRSRRPVA